MIKLLEGIEDVEMEIQCKECGSVVHCEGRDWEGVRYFYGGHERTNEMIECPKCHCYIYRWEDWE